MRRRLKMDRLLNRSDAETSVGVSWGPWSTLVMPDGNAMFTVRDLWRQKNLGEFKSKFESQVALHGVVLVRLVPVKQ